MNYLAQNIIKQTELVLAKPYLKRKEKEVLARSKERNSLIEITRKEITNKTEKTKKEISLIESYLEGKSKLTKDEVLMLVG